MEKTSLIYDHYPYNPCSDPIDDEESEPSFDIRCPLHDHGGCREGAGDGECEDLTDPELDLIFTRVEGQDNSWEGKYCPEERLSANLLLQEESSSKDPEKYI